MTNSVLISSGDHNSRVNILPKDEGDLISLEESECAEIEDLDLSKTDEGGNHMYSATSFTKKQDQHQHIQLQ